MSAHRHIEVDVLEVLEHVLGIRPDDLMLSSWMVSPDFEK